MAAPAFHAVGSVGRSAAALTVAWPDHQADDIGLLLVESANQAVTLTTPAGFVEVTDSPQGVGVAGTSGATRLTAFWCRATSAAMASPVIADSGDHQIAVIVVFRGCIATGNPWDVTAGDTSAASTSLTIPTDTTTVDEALVVLCVANNGPIDDQQLSTPPVNANLVGITKIVDSQPNPPEAGATLLKVGPYGQLTELVGIGPGGDTGAPYYRIAGVNPHESASAMSTLQAQLDLARDRGITVCILVAGNPNTYGANTATGFSATDYNANLDVLDAAVPTLNEYFADGTAIAYGGDEPNHGKWNNSNNVSTFTPTRTNQCCREIKTRWPDAYTFFRVDCVRLRDGWGGNNGLAAYDALDFGVMQYEGPHARAGQTFLEAYDEDVLAGDAIGVGCIPSLNLWAGGNHALNDGVQQCWDYNNDGTSSGVIAGAVQNTGSPYTKGQRIACATWNATPAPKPTLCSSPAWIRRVGDVAKTRADIPWLFLWTYMRTGLSDNSWAGPLQVRADFVSALDYMVSTAQTRSSADALPARKVYP